ncbi:hypothetical protein ACS3QZ_16605 [Shimia sp. W99]
MSIYDSPPPELGYAEMLETGDFVSGFLKCRLVHMLDRSIIIPDLLCLNGDEQRFYSPKFFDPNRIFFGAADEKADLCILPIELIGSVDVQVAFFNHGFVKRCEDGSFIYHCVFRIDPQLLPEAQGEWRSQDDRIEIALFHHTTGDGHAGILGSGEIWSSAWNIQGTRELENVAYGYFTSVPKIEDEAQLLEIAMSSQGVAHFVPTHLPYDPQFAQPLQVYRQSTGDRDHTLRFWVDVETVAPNHLWFHSPGQGRTYYEIVLPKVFRIAVEPGQPLKFQDDTLSHRPIDCKSLGYVIVGDADSPVGLFAPYNEEQTEYLGKVDPVKDSDEILRHWESNQNSDVFNGIKIELARLIDERKSGDG